MLTNDGIFAIYIVMSCRPGGNWKPVTSKDGWWTSATMDRAWEEISDFGPCFRNTGIHGSFREECATDIAQDLALSNRHHSFKVVCVGIKQVTVWQKGT